MTKFAVLIACNYQGTPMALRGCVNDATRMKDCLISNCEFIEENIDMLLDTTSDSSNKPTGHNIRSALSSMIAKAKAGDTLYVHYSGHGMHIDSKKCIVPCDYNLITDGDIRDIVDTVPLGCVMTIVADCCYSGGLIKNGKQQIGKSIKKEHTLFGSIIKFFRSLFGNRRIKPHDIHGDCYIYVKNRSLAISTFIDILKLKFGKDDINEGNLMHTLYDIFGEDASPEFGLERRQHEGDENGGWLEILGLLGKQKVYPRSTRGRFLDRGILLSASQSDQEAEEVNFPGNPNEVYGVFSNAILTTIEEAHDQVTNSEVVLNAREKLESQHFTQKPGLYCGDYLVDIPFVCDQ